MKKILVDLPSDQLLDPEQVLVRVRGKLGDVHPQRFDHHCPPFE
jgi:hypothetical protein